MENENSTEKPSPKINPEEDKKINEYIECKPKQFEYYRNLVAENPERAARSLMYKDLLMEIRKDNFYQKFAQNAKEWLNQQPSEVREKIENKLKSVNRFSQNTALVNEVKKASERNLFRHNNNKNRVKQ